MRIYSPNYGKFFSVDPIATKYPHYTPYQFAGNKPIVAIDLDGKEDLWVHYQENDDCSLFEVHRDYDVSKLQNMAISEANGGMFVPNTGVVYTVDHLDGSNSITMGGGSPAVTISEFRDNIIVRAKKSFGNGLDRFQSKIMGSSYGQGENWVQSTTIGGSASISFNKYSATLSGGIYSTQEDYAGAFLKLELTAAAQKTSGEKFSLTNFELPKSNFFIGVTANTSNDFHNATISNDTKMSGQISSTLPSGIGGSIGTEKSLISGSSNKSASLGMSTGKGLSGQAGVQNTTTILFKTEQGKVSGNK